MKRIKKFLFIEDGSVLAETVEKVEQRNPEIKVIVYRQGAAVPILVEVKK